MDGGVPADDEVTSLTARGGTPGGPGWPVAFTTTHWSVVLDAQGESPEAQEALEKLCRVYWRPIYGFVRRQGHTPEEAQDLTQSFFAFLLERKGLDTVGPEKGRLRSFFLASVRNFLANAHRSAMAGKRGHGRPALSLEELVGREHAHLATRHFDRRSNL